MTAGGIVRGLPAAEYHAMKALSASGAWALVEECPARFWHASPWNPDFAPDRPFSEPTDDDAQQLSLAPADDDEPSLVMNPAKKPTGGVDWCGLAEAMAARLAELPDEMTVARFERENASGIELMRTGDKGAWGIVKHAISERRRELTQAGA